MAKQLLAQYFHQHKIDVPRKTDAVPSDAVPSETEKLIHEKEEQPDAVPSDGRGSRNRWQTILITSCVIAVTFDPLFFYIPYNDEERKCLGSDNGVQTVALVLRSITDIAFLVNIIRQLQVATAFALTRVTVDETLIFDYDRMVSKQQIIQFARAFSHKLSWRSFITDVLSILPLPQVLIVGLFFDIGGNDYLLRRKVMSAFVLLQFLPRIYRIYLSSVTVIESASLWIKGLFNFFLYILASHVLGAFWYFFSIQREVSCWYQNCIDAKKPEQCTFYCHGNSTSALITSDFNTTLNQQCLLKIPYNMIDPPFDFGIFFGVLKNDIQGKIDFPQKIGYCFWWGLRNLSNFGTSLETSTYLWENSFAIVISVVGLLLFLYLIGNVQIYMDRATNSAEEVQDKYRKKEKDIEFWMETHKLNEDIKEEIRNNIKQKLKEDITKADLDDVFSLLPKYTYNVVKQIIGLRTLRNVPMFRLVDPSILKTICEHLQPVKYEVDKVVYYQGDPFDKMVFIIDGSMTTYTSSTTDDSQHSGEEEAEVEETQRLKSMPHMRDLKKGDAYGHMLLQLASSSASMGFAISLMNVRCTTKVEAFVLTDKNLKKIVSKCGDFWIKCLDYNAAASEDKGAVLIKSFSQHKSLKRRASSTVNPTADNYMV